MIKMFMYILRFEMKTILLQGYREINKYLEKLINSGKLQNRLLLRRISMAGYLIKYAPRKQDNKYLCSQKNGP